MFTKDLTVNYSFTAFFVLLCRIAVAGVLLWMGNKLVDWVIANFPVGV